ncbi:MAG: DUF169 domain-containing protein [Gammaproteobacteria bacterium]|jgi:uncharacterized protein (DUF169 family)|nr:DUF169 domain-containing protein [Gammaproteobacteria bacterium]
MTENSQRSNQLTVALSLPLTPIAIAFTNELPDGIAKFDSVVPAGCSFWEKASSGCFATTSQDHQNCSIGIHTHNLSNAPASQSEELKTALEAMIGLDYVRESEIAEIPTMEQAHEYVIYGPLSDFPLEPNAVLLFAEARQGLTLSEAISRVDANLPPAMGRPACAVIPQVIKQNQAAMSLGCCGARAYLKSLTDSVALWALPGSKLSEYCDQIEVLANANKTLTTLHRQRGEAINAGESPTMTQSLEKLMG